MSKEHTIEPVQDLISIPGNEIKQELINHLRSEVYITEPNKDTK